MSRPKINSQIKMEHARHIEAELNGVEKALFRGIKNIRQSKADLFGLVTNRNAKKSPIKASKIDNIKSKIRHSDMNA